MSFLLYLYGVIFMVIQGQISMSGALSQGINKIATNMVPTLDPSVAATAQALGQAVLKREGEIEDVETYLSGGLEDIKRYTKGDNNAQSAIIDTHILDPVAVAVQVNQMKKREAAMADAKKRLALSVGGVESPPIIILGEREYSALEKLAIAQSLTCSSRQN